MAVEPPIISLTYRSYRALDADHAAYIMHGGIMVPLQSPLPSSADVVQLELTVPDGSQFKLPSRVERRIEGQGLLLGFEPETQSIQAQIELLVSSSSFVNARDAEPEHANVAPEAKLKIHQAPQAFASLHQTVEAKQNKDGSPRGVDLTDRLQIPEPKPGESFLTAVIRYPTLMSFLPDVKRLEELAKLTYPPPDTPSKHGDIVFLRITLPGHNIFELWSIIHELTSSQVILRLDATSEPFRRLCLFPESHNARNRREREERMNIAPESASVMYVRKKVPDEVEKMPLRRRIQRMGMEDKINLALSGSREERMALAQDGNRNIHHYLLKNAKLTIDEVAFMARLTSLNPDVLDKIAENPGYTQNPQVTRALVFNPRTPIRTAVRLLDRLPRSDVLLLSKRTGMNRRLVMAAKNKISGNRW